MTKTPDEATEFIAGQRELTDWQLINKITFTTEIHESAVLYASMQEYAASLRDTLKVLDTIREERGLAWPEGVRK
jgi:hypothetical protein